MAGPLRCTRPLTCRCTCPPPPAHPATSLQDSGAGRGRRGAGFRDVVVASRCTPAAHLSDHNENYVDGDISAGAASIRQLFARPTPRLDPYFSGRTGVYLCSASTPPGPGVHGLGGWFAAKRVLREFGISSMLELGSR